MPPEVQNQIDGQPLDRQPTLSSQDIAVSSENYEGSAEQTPSELIKNGDILGMAIDPNNPFADTLSNESTEDFQEKAPNTLYLGVPPEEQEIMQQDATSQSLPAQMEETLPQSEISPVAIDNKPETQPDETIINPPIIENITPSESPIIEEITSINETGLLQEKVAIAEEQNEAATEGLLSPEQEEQIALLDQLESGTKESFLSGEQIQQLPPANAAETADIPLENRHIQSENPVIDPRIKEIFAEGNTILSALPDPNASDGFDVNPLLEKQEKEKTEKSNKKHSSRLTQSLYIVSALAIGFCLLATTLLIGGSQLEKKTLAHINDIEAFGETRIEISSGEGYFIKGEYPIFGGETITIGNGNAIIDFAEGSQIRLNEKSKIKIHQVFPNPVISLYEGEIWAYGNRALRVLGEQSVFYVRSNSARFNKIGDKMTASSYLHPLFVELTPPGTNRAAAFAIPSKKRIVFAEQSIPRALPNLHFSKLKKEIHFSDAEQDAWSNKNVVEDGRYIAKLAEDLKLDTKNHTLGKGIVASIQDIAVVFPDKKRRNLHASADNKFDVYLSELITDGKPFSVQSVELPDDAIDQAIATTNLIEPNKNLVFTGEELRSEARKRNLNGNAERIIAQNVLAFLEDALEKKDAALAESILTTMVTDWGTAKKTEENKIMLEMYREIIADLFRKNIDIVTPAILHASTRLDTIAISWGKQQMAIITTLEVIEKNLLTADIFLEKSKLEMSKNLLDINDVLFRIRPTSDLNSSYESMQNRQEFLREKYGIFKTQGWLSKTELYELLRKRNDARRILGYMQEEERKILEMNQIIAESVPLADQIREEFLQNKLMIISMIGAEDEKAKVVEIVEAKLPDGQTFSGEYLPEFKVIRNVKVEGEVAAGTINNELKLSKLISTIESLRVNNIINSGEDLRELRTNPLPKLEEDPVDKMDPIVIEVTKRLAQATLVQKGFQIQLKDVLITAPNMLHMRNVQFDVTNTNTLEFDFDNDSKVISNVYLMPENIAVSANSLDHVSGRALMALAEYNRQLSLQDQVEFALMSAGLEIASEDIRYTPAGIHFQNATYHDWVMSGLANADRQIYIDITKGGKSFLKNTSFESLGGTLKSKWEAEESIKTLDPNGQ